MIVFQINVVVNWGSTGHIVEEIGSQLVNNGHTSYIAFGRKCRKSNSILVRIGSLKDILWHYLRTVLFDQHGLSSNCATRKLINKIKKLNPDIIHLHNIHGYYLNYPLLFSYLSEANIPVVWTLHDCWAYTGHCAYYSSVSCMKWKELCSDCPQKKSYPISLGGDRSAKNFLGKRKSFTSIPNLTIVTVSHWLSYEIGESFLSNFPREVIYNGVDLDIFKIYPSRKDKYVEGNKILILGVASVWNERKGLKDFEELSRKLSNDYQIILVGLTRKQISNLSVNIKGITYTESVQDLAELYSSSDIYINLSIEETLGMTTVESLACGTPAIVYNSTACPEVVSIETGIIVDSHDINGVINAIDEIKTKGKVYYQHSCRERAKEFFDKSNQYARYIKLYERILSEK